MYAARAVQFISIVSVIIEKICTVRNGRNNELKSRCCEVNVRNKRTSIYSTYDLATLHLTGERWLWFWDGMSTEGWVSCFTSPLCTTRALTLICRAFPRQTKPWWRFYMWGSFWLLASVEERTSLMFAFDLSLRMKVQNNWSVRLLPCCFSHKDLWGGRQAHFHPCNHSCPARDGEQCER